MTRKFGNFFCPLSRKPANVRVSFPHSPHRLDPGHAARSRCGDTPEDALLLGITDGDRLEIRTALGSVTMLAQLTRSIQRGMVSVLPDYEEADICSILPDDCVDPCSWRSSIRMMSCSLHPAQA